MGCKAKPYVHKAINIESGFGNIYLERMLSEFPKLKGIYEGEIPYSYGDYPRLIECFEMLYKGTYEKLRELDPDKLPDASAEMRVGHHFSPFARRIHKFIPLSDTADGRDHILETLGEIESSYNNARFRENIPIEEFRKNYRRLDLQVNRMITGIKAKEEIRASEISDTDLNLW